MKQSVGNGMRRGALAAWVGLATLFVQAGEYTWDGSTLDNWNSAHWLPGNVAGPTTGGNTATINSGTIVLQGSDLFGWWGITTSPTVFLKGGVLKSTNTFNNLWNLHLGGGTLLANGGAHSSAQAFQLAGTLTVTGSSPSFINVVNGGNNGLNAVNLGGQNDTALTIQVADVTGDANPDLTVNTILRNSGPMGALPLVKTGSGTLLLTAANVFSGGVRINAGTVAVSNNAALGTASFTIVSNSTVSALASLNVTNDCVISNGVAVTFDVSAGNALTLLGIISGPGGLTKSGAGTATLQNAMTYTGDTTVSGGTLKLAYLPDGTVAYYGFNDSANLGVDGSSQNNALKTAAGVPQYSANGKFGGALYLNGSSKLGTVSGLFPSGVPTGAAPYTVAAYVRAETNCNVKGGWIGYGNQENSRCNNFRLKEDTPFSGVWNYWWGNDMGASLPSGSFTDGWHSVVGTWDGTTEALYLDSVKTWRTPGTKIDVGTNEFVIGRTIGDAYFTGWADNILIANRALTAAEITTLHADGVRDCSLPDGTALRINSGAVMDLNGVRQTVASLSGSGTVTGGTLTVTGRLAPGDNSAVISALMVMSDLVLAAGVTNAFDCTSATSDVIQVSKSLTLKGTGVVQLSLGEAQQPPRQVTLFTFDTLSGGSNLTSWSVMGISDGYRTQLVAREKDIILTSVLKGLLVMVK